MTKLKKIFDKYLNIKELKGKIRSLEIQNAVLDEEMRVLVEVEKRKLKTPMFFNETVVKYAEATASVLANHEELKTINEIGNLYLEIYEDGRKSLKKQLIPEIIEDLRGTRDDLRRSIDPDSVLFVSDIEDVLEEMEDVIEKWKEKK